jgi:hypothetical protein
VSRLRSNNTGVRNLHWKAGQVLEALLDLKFWLISAWVFSCRSRMDLNPGHNRPELWLQRTHLSSVPDAVWFHHRKPDSWCTISGL